MAVLYWQRTNDGTQVSGKLGEPMTITERYQIRVDSPVTNKAQIVAATSVGWNTAHHEFPSCVAQEFDLAPVDRSGMLWTLTVKFYPPEPGKILKANNIPEDYWDMQGGTAVFPLFVDIAGDTITNSAGDPLEGLEIEKSTATVSLTKMYETDADLKSDLVAYVDTVNNATWFGWPAEHVKCVFRGASKKTSQLYANEESDTLLEWIEAKWDFEYKEGGWRSKPWDVGFMELVSGERQAVLGDDGKPVQQPVALTSAGAAKPAGEAPDVINGGDGVEIYQQADFTTGFGEPTFIAEA